VSVLLESRDLSVRRGNTVILHRVHLAVGAGEAHAIVGPNAAGKSTLLRALAGLLPATSGTIWVKGRPLGEWSRDSLARAVAFVASEDVAPPSLTVEQRAALGRYPHRGALRPLTSEDHRAVRTALARTGIEELAPRRLGTLSAGERQLAALARGLAQEPDVLLLDEPAAHLDVGHQLRLFRVLDEVRAEGVAVVAVVHDLQRAAGWADRMVLIAGGQVAAEGAPEVVLSSEASALAFAVAIRAHRVGELTQPLYTFEERP